MAKTERYYSRLDPRGAAVRLGLAVVLGIGTAFFLAPAHGWVVQAVAGWDVAALTQIVLIWWIIWPSDADETQCRAALADPGRNMVWLLVLVASCFSLFAGTVVLRHAPRFEPQRPLLLVILSLIAVVFAWSLTHSAYTLRYAHLYYRDDRRAEGGLIFPGKHKPDDFDFAYFSFTIGMCFQVSDVAVVSRQIRRAVLGHAILSFAYNTVIFALILNLLVGFLS
jgi:uncharacterized membrane protein